MRLVRSSLAGLLACLALSAPAAHATDKISIVAAENFYGSIAEQIGGDTVTVTGILSSPDQDPHLFEVSPSTARTIDGAQIVIVNGAGYDSWMDKLLSASSDGDRTVINAAKLVGVRAGDNPHVWYKPQTFPAVAERIAETLGRINPDHADAYEKKLNALKTAFSGIHDRIARIRKDHDGTPVTATEPVFGYMAGALGFEMVNEGFQTAEMNGTEPSPGQVAGFENSLKDGRAKILFYNAQVTGPTTQRLLALARKSNIATVGVTETKPAGKSVVEWLSGELDAIERALQTAS